WFQENSPSTERFLYLIDESENYAQTQQWANWVKAGRAKHSELKTFATADLVKTESQMPSLDISASWIAVAPTAPWNAAFAAEKADGHRVYSYNGMRPASG